jgi:hypothetical protein
MATTLTLVTPAGAVQLNVPEVVKACWPGAAGGAGGSPMLHPAPILHPGPIDTGILFYTFKYFLLFFIPLDPAITDRLTIVVSGIVISDHSK